MTGGLRARLEATRWFWVPLGLALAVVGAYGLPLGSDDPAVSEVQRAAVTITVGLWILGIHTAIAVEMSRPLVRGAGRDRALAVGLTAVLAGPVPVLVGALALRRYVLGEASFTFDFTPASVRTLAFAGVYPVVLAFLLASWLIVRRRGTCANVRWYAGLLLGGVGGMLVWDAFVASAFFNVPGAAFATYAVVGALGLYAYRLVRPRAAAIRPPAAPRPVYPDPEPSTRPGPRT